MEGKKKRGKLISPLKFRLRVFELFLTLASEWVWPTPH